jgi:hypothetical protein
MVATAIVSGYQDYAAAWNAANPVYAANTAAAGASNLSNRQGAYQVEFAGTGWTWAAATLQKAKTVDAKGPGTGTW